MLRAMSYTTSSEHAQKGPALPSSKFTSSIIKISFYRSHTEKHIRAVYKPTTESLCSLCTTVFPDLQMYPFFFFLSKPIIYDYKTIIIKNSGRSETATQTHKWNSDRKSELYMTHEPVDILSIAICHIKRTGQFFWTTKQPGWLFSDYFGEKLCAGHGNRLWVVVQKQCIYEVLASICPITEPVY